MYKVQSTKSSNCQPPQVEKIKKLKMKNFSLAILVCLSLLSASCKKVEVCVECVKTSPRGDTLGTATGCDISKDGATKKAFSELEKDTAQGVIRCNEK